MLAVVPGPLWRGEFDLQRFLTWCVRDMSAPVICGDGASINWMVMLWPRKENRKGKERKGEKREKKKKKKIYFPFQVSIIQKIYDTKGVLAVPRRKMSPLPTTMPGSQGACWRIQTREIPANASKVMLGTGLADCAAPICGEKNKHKISLQSKNNRSKKI